MVEITFAVDGTFGVGCPEVRLTCIGSFANCRVTICPRPTTSITILSKANIVVTGIDLYLRKDNARYCSLRNAVNSENVNAGGILNKLSEPIASLLVSRPVFA
jgi:hypothetical protein